jgi:uncharacterized membrane protein YsdA (DUF1294 family)
LYSPLAASHWREAAAAFLLSMLKITLAIYAAMSVLTLAAYGWDKRCAARGRRRVRERTLHACELLGGWPGALVGQQLFRHKRRKWAFLLVTAAIVLVHIAAWVCVMRRGA